MKITLLALASFIIISSAYTYADDVRVYSKDEIPDPSEIAKMLRVEKHRPALKMRGIVFKSAVNDETIDHDIDIKPYVYKDNTGEEIARKTRQFSLPIPFDHNSAKIKEAALPALKAVAEGLKMVPDSKIIIEGHTDSSGSESYNLLLSMRRAESVKKYFIVQQGLSEDHFEVSGKGESSPLDGRRAADPVNRRVQFRLAE